MTAIVLRFVASPSRRVMVTGCYKTSAIDVLSRICGETHSSITAFPAQGKGLAGSHTLQSRECGKCEPLGLRDGGDCESEACEEGAGKHGLELRLLMESGFAKGVRLVRRGLKGVKYVRKRRKSCSSAD